MDLGTNVLDRRSNNLKTRILLVDDDEDLLTITQLGLESNGFEVTATSTVTEALRFISSEQFDVLLTDLRMPHAGDGFTVVSAMRHAQPKALTLLLSGFPDIQEAMNAIKKQADEVLIKPLGVAKIAEIIKKRISKPKEYIHIKKESAATILERDTGSTIQDWMSRVEDNEELMALALLPEERTGHLPLILADLVRRLRSVLKDPISISAAAHKHGILRRIQGYTVAMMVEESRLLQISIFNSLQNNLAVVDFDTVLLDIMTIADEVDSQLKQAVLGFVDSGVPKAKQVPA
jgi:ActR/RegA family two-component response regulator